jgi:hypothetical protein
MEKPQPANPKANICKNAKAIAEVLRMHQGFIRCPEVSAR